jgi:hypothetical protein
MFQIKQKKKKKTPNKTKTNEPQFKKIPWETVQASSFEISEEFSFSNQLSSLPTLLTTS